MTLRKTIFWTHLGVGLAAGLVILSMCVTGLMLAFEPQIVDFAERGIRSVPLPDPAVQRLPMETLLARVSDYSPQAAPTALSQGSDPTASVVVRLGREGSIYVNPYTGAILGKESAVHRWLHTAEEWHRWFGSKDIGKPITGAGAIAFLALSLSGVYLWWPRNGISFKGAASYKGGSSSKARDWNWHTVTGFWASLYFIMITTTGICMSYTWASNLLYKVTGSPVPASPTAPKRDGPPSPGGRGNGPDFKGLNALWTKAEQQVPGWQSIFLRIPPYTGTPVTFFISDPSSGRSKGRSQLTLDPRGKIVKWEPYQDFNKGRRLRMWVTPLHTGRAWGWPGQTLNFVAAAAGILLIYTGFALSWRRFFSKNGGSKKPKRAAA